MLNDLFWVQFQRWLPRCLESAGVAQVAPMGDWHKPLYFKMNKPVIRIGNVIGSYDAPDLWVFAAQRLAASIRSHFGHFYSDLEYDNTIDYLAAVVTLGRVYQIAHPEDYDERW